MKALKISLSALAVASALVAGPAHAGKTVDAVKQPQERAHP